MANIWMERGVEYHKVSREKIFQENEAVRMTRTYKQEEKNPSKLELLRQDYRARLLQERERKVNALFEQKVRAKSLPKKGGVRQFFAYRRMMEIAVSNPVNLPPISCSHKKGKR